MSTSSSSRSVPDTGSRRGAGDRVSLEQQVPRVPEIVVDLEARPLWNEMAEALGAITARFIDVAAAVREVDSDDVGPASLVLLSGRTADGAPSELTVRRLRTLNVHVPVLVAVVNVRMRDVPVKAYARAGVDALFLMDIPFERGEFVKELRARLTLPVPARLLDALGRLLRPGVGRTIGCWCMRNATRTCPVRRVVDYFRVDERRLDKEVETLGLPPVGTLLRLGCHHRALELEASGALSMEGIAEQLGFPDAKSLAAMRRHLRGSPRLAAVASPIRELLMMGLEEV